MNQALQSSLKPYETCCIGVLITNLGTPDSCRVSDVRRFLREFLWDRRVVEMPRLWWWLILNLAVLPTRPRASARAYQKIWRADGSPLLSIARRQQDKLQRRFDSVALDSAALQSASIHVELGMRYGNPSIASALAKLKAAGARHLLALPLYPQYSAAATASAFDAIFAALESWRWLPALRLINGYHHHRGYLTALANQVRDYQRSHGAGELLLMSFHGLPQAQCDAGDPYYRQCHATARRLAEELQLAEDAWKITFQSRFGAAEWLQPYTDQSLIDLAKSGIRHVQVMCPGFSADCLETLQETALENRDVFIRAGGESYACIPCLNDGDQHMDALATIISDNIRDWMPAP